MQILIVIVVIFAGAFEVDVSNWSPFAPNGMKSIFTGATVVFFAYVGFDAVANSAEESKRPQVYYFEIAPVVYEFFRCRTCYLMFLLTTIMMLDVNSDYLDFCVCCQMP